MNDEPAGTAGDEDGYTCDCECVLCEVGGIRHRHGSEIADG